MEKCRVIIAEESAIYRRGVRSLLTQMKDIELVGEAEHGPPLLELLERTEPDILLVDVDLPGVGGLEIARTIKRTMPHIKVIILTSREDDEQRLASIKAGAAHYLNKNLSPEAMIKTIRQVSEGQYLINDDLLTSPRLARQVLEQFQHLIDTSDEAGALYAPLTQRETQILDQIAQGNSNKQIARALNISDQTVKNHITSILRKLQVNDRTQAVVYAYRQGWIKVSEEVLATGGASGWLASPAP